MKKLQIKEIRSKSYLGFNGRGKFYSILNFLKKLDFKIQSADIAAFKINSYIRFTDERKR